MKVGGKIQWNVYTYLRNVTDLLCPMKDLLGNHLKDRLFHVGSFVEYYSITAKDQSRIHQFGKKVFTWMVPRICFVRGGELGRVTY